jgi:predicted RNase H-like HicB family nuclease
MEQIQMTEDALNYKNEWVAFSGDFHRVVGHGPTPEEATAQARSAGEKHAILLFIPEVWPDQLGF